MDGGAWHVTAKLLGMSKSLLRPMSMVGANARDRKCWRGYQYLRRNGGMKGWVEMRGMKPGPV
jgi:hypothetical protein